MDSRADERAHMPSVRAICPKTQQNDLSMFDHHSPFSLLRLPRRSHCVDKPRCWNGNLKKKTNVAENGMELERAGEVGVMKAARLMAHCQVRVLSAID